jgi:hypothetical protein
MIGTEKPMDIKPYLGRLIAGLKDAIADITKIAIGIFIALAVAGLSPYDRYGVYWMMIFAGVQVVYGIIVWPLQIAWSRWGTSQNRSL